MVSSNTKVVQVTNIAPQATKDQMQTLFGYLGKIEDIRLYPTIRDVSCPVQSRICYVKFVDSATVGIAQHMTNTVFIDRALIVIPVINGDIPDEYYALEMTRNGTIVPGFNVNEPKLPPHVVSAFQGTGENKVVVTNDPQLVDNGLTPYPPLPAKYDSIKVEETRRTIQVCNIDPSIPPEEIIEFFSTAGEVNYLRMCESPADGSTKVLIEFTEQPSVVQAFKMNGEDFKGKALEIIHATQPIIKPQAKSNEAAQKEIEEAMSRFKEAQNMINASIEPVIGMLTKDKRSSRRSRSRSHGRRRRSRSVSHGRRRRRSSSRSRKSRSKERRKRSKSRSLSSKRSKSSRRSRSRKRSHSKSPKRRSKNRSKERDSRARSREKKSKTPERPRDKERTREKSREKESKTRERDSKVRERSRDKDSKARDRSREKDSKIRGRSREKDSKARDKSRDRQARGRDKSRDRDSKARERSRDRKREKSRRSKERESGRRSRDRRSKEKEKSSRNPRDKKNEKEDSIEGTASERKRSRSRSLSRRRSSSRDRKPRDRDRHRKRSRSKGRKRSVSPRKKRTRSRSGDRKKDRKDRRDRRDKSRSRSKVRRNYDEEEKGFDTERAKESDYGNDKESSEKSDNMDISNSP